MACRGVYFALTEEQAARVLAAENDDALMAVIEEVEEAWDEENLGECDKAWDAIHRLLTNGQMKVGHGEYPLSHCVLGGRWLYEGNDYIVTYLTPAEVQDVAQALAPLTEQWIKQRYDTVVPKDYAPEYGPDDREYTWEYFQMVRDLYQRAAGQGKAVIFTVDQ
jgi:hypothetical protein